MTVVTGPAPGPTVAVVAGVHGGKVAAVQAVEQLRSLLAGRLRRGRVLLVAPANVAGFSAGLAQRSPDDSLNLNRVFPGDPAGRPTERLAARILREIVSQSNYLLDLHGSDGDEAVGRFAYAARPGVDPRVDSAARTLAEWWGTPVIVWDEGGPRSLADSRFLQTAAHLSGVPAITVFEAGATREDRAATSAFVVGTLRVLVFLDLVAADAPEAAAGATGGTGAALPRPAEATDVRAPSPMLLARRAVVTAATTGRWETSLQPGETVAPGEPVGRLWSSSRVEVVVRAPEGGRALHVRRSGPVDAGVPLVITGLPAPH